MAAVMGMDPAAIALLCSEAAEGQIVGAANFNAPGQIVIAGNTAAVARASTLASSRGGKVIPLKVSAPFHCALMRPAALRLASELTRVVLGEIAFPVIANVDGEPNTDAAARVPDLLVRQIDGPVQWVRSIERMASEGVTHALEIGPGRVLANLVKRITKSIKVLSIGDEAAIAKVQAFLADA